MPTEMASKIESSPWFYRTDSPYAIVDTYFRIRAVNPAYVQATHHPRSAMIGEPLFEVFPDNPAVPLADGVAKLSASLEEVFTDGKRHWMGVQQYDVPDPNRPDSFIYKVWAPTNSAIYVNGRVVAALHHVEDVTEVAPARADGIVWEEITESASDLWRLFPCLPYEAVIATLTDSHAVVYAYAGRPEPERAVELATVRLELLAGHPRLGPPVSSHLRTPPD